MEQPGHDHSNKEQPSPLSHMKNLYLMCVSCDNLIFLPVCDMPYTLVHIWCRLATALPGRSIQSAAKSWTVLYDNEGCTTPTPCCTPIHDLYMSPLPTHRSLLTETANNKQQLCQCCMLFHRLRPVLWPYSSHCMWIRLLIGHRMCN